MIVSATSTDPGGTAVTALEEAPAAEARWAVARGVASAALLLGYGADLGVAAERCLAGTGLSAADVEDPTAEITARQELTVVENLVRICGDTPGLGLGAGMRYGLHVYGIFGFAVLSSATLREAIGVAERFRELAYALVDVHSEMRGDEICVVLDDRATPALARRFVVERDAAAITLMQRELFAEPVPLARVTLTVPTPEDLGPYERAFGVVPDFGAPANTLVIDAARLDLPLPRASEYAAAQCQEQCQVLLDRRRRRAGLAGAVRRELLADPRAMPDQAAVAAGLGMSVRTLRRRLADEGTSFRAVLAETRALLAQELLETGQLTVEGVADRLGYAEASSFVHAFTRWSGTSPGRWRRGAQPPTPIGR